MPSINRTEQPYTALAGVYQAAGLSQYSVGLAPRLQEIAFEMEWTGRSLYDMACGTGDMALFFARKGFRVLGVDNSPAMIEMAAAASEAESLGAEFVAGDIRTYTAQSQYDLVTCLGGSINYILSPNDLGTVFKQAHSTLASGKLFIFDMMTIQGLARPQEVDRILLDNEEDTMILVRESYTYDTTTLTQQYHIFRYSEKVGWKKAEEAGWQRYDETHTLRSYPVQAVKVTLEKAGFEVKRMFTRDLKPAEALRDLDQVTFFAIKKG